MSQKTVLVLCAGPLQRPAILAAKAMGHKVIAMDGNPKAVGLAEADLALVVDIRDANQVLTALRHERLDGAMTLCTEVPLNALAAVNERFDLLGPRAEQIRNVTDKGRMRACFQSFGAPSPRSIPCSDLEQARAAYRAIGGRVIVKPASGMGSRGITDLESDMALPDAFYRAMSFSQVPQVLLEEFVDGREFSIEALTWNGRTEVVAITDKITTGSPFWVEMGHTQPTTANPEARTEIIAATILGIQALGLDWTATHTEVKLGPKGARLIEVGGRLGGDFITTHLTPLSTGVNIVEDTIRVCLGETPRLTYFDPARGSAIRYMGFDTGRLLADPMLDAARQVPGVALVDCLFYKGDKVPEIRSSLNRSAWVIAHGETRETAIGACEQGLAKIKYQVEP